MDYSIELIIFCMHRLHSDYIGKKLIHKVQEEDLKVEKWSVYDALYTIDTILVCRYLAVAAVVVVKV